MQLWFQQHLEVLHFSEELLSPENIEGDTSDAIIVQGCKANHRKPSLHPLPLQNVLPNGNLRWRSLTPTLNNTFLTPNSTFLLTVFLVKNKKYYSWNLCNDAVQTTDIQTAVAVLLYYTVYNLGIAKASGEGFVLFHTLGGTPYFPLVPREDHTISRIFLYISNSTPGSFIHSIKTTTIDLQQQMLSSVDWWL